MMDNIILPEVVHIDSPMCIETLDYFDGSRNYVKESDRLCAMSTDNKICVCTYDCLPSYIDILCPKMNETYLLSPFLKGMYIELDKFEEHCQKMKQAAFVEIIKLLGAKSYSVEVSVNKCYERKVSARGEMSCVAVKMDASIDKKSTFEKRLSSKHNDLFEGGDVEYDKACRKVKEFNLDRNVDVISLLMSRNPNDINRISKRVCEINVTSESNESLDIACRLKVMAFKLNNNFEEATRYKYECSTKTTIEF